MYFSYCRSSRRIEGGPDSALAKYIDQSWTELGLVGADGKEGLDGIVCEGGDLRIDPITSELQAVVSAGERSIG